MGIFQKLKDILFDEEENTEQIKITPEMRNEETPTQKKEEVKEKPVEVKREIKEEVKVAHKAPEPIEMPTVRPVEIKKEVPVSNSNLSERELFKSEKTFPFVDFDEDKFEKQNVASRVTSSVSMPKEVEQKRSTNVFEYERRKKIEKRTDFGRYEKIETTETVERKKFKPSPIISPVYGIKDKDYQKEDIIQKSDLHEKNVHLKEVRDRAFGEKKPLPKVEDEKSNYYEEEKTVTITPLSEKERKVKTIDELLEDTTDVVVDVDRNLDREVEDILPRLDKRKTTIEDEELKEDTKEMKVPIKEENTLENDLFDLIDSMYDNKEDGE